MSDIKLGIGYEIINSYKRLSYKQWFALAEYIDNSTQAYFNNPGLDDIFKSTGEVLTVNILYSGDGKNASLSIEDNSIGMSYEELQKAVIIGSPPTNTSGRSRYGLGMKTASFWLGNEWQVVTKKLGETQEHTISISLENIVKNDGELVYSLRDNLDEDTHYTHITINDLNQPFNTRTRNKVKEYLRSMYRNDIYNKNLKLIWQNEELSWTYDEVWGDFVKMADGEDRVNFEFKIEDKSVTGWAAVLQNGSRGKAGFSIFHNGRVITGWPNAYKPESIFGAEGGRNDLINQRVVGEIYMDDFTVSHTKDAIIFEKDEEDVLEFLMREKISTILTLANQTNRGELGLVVIDDVTEMEYQKAIGFLEVEFNSVELKDAFNSFEIPDEEIIEENIKVLLSQVSSRSEPTFTVNLGSLLVRVYLESNISMNDPYLSLRLYSIEDKLDVLINKCHPHWRELQNSETIMNYIRHCVYDGVAEWKAAKFTSEVKPDTVKTIKDNLLRTSYNIRMDVNK